MINKSIVFIEYTYYNGRGNWDRELIKLLAEKGYDVHAITCTFAEQFKDEERTLKDLGVKFHFIPSNKFEFVVLSTFNAYRIVRKNKAILYVPSIRLIPFYYPIKKVLKIPIIFSLQGAGLKEMDIMPEYKDLRKHEILFKIKRKIIAWLEKWSAKLADTVIVISKAIENELIQLGVPKEKINLIYYAIDTNLFKKDLEKRKEIRKRYDIKDDEILINYTARLSIKDAPTKMCSAKMLIKTFAGINNANAKIMFVGGGDGIKSLKDLCKFYDIEHKVIFVGFVTHHKVPNFLSASNIFWFVMRDPLPTYGLALQEAMSCENIVITNNSGSMKEIIHNNVNGFLVEPDVDEMREKLEEILQKHDEKLKEIKKVARKDVEEKYSWDVILPRVEAILSKVTKK